MSKKLLINFFRNKAYGIDTNIREFEEYFNSVCYEYHKDISMLSNNLDNCKCEDIEVQIIEELKDRAMDEVIILQNLVEFLIESNNKKDFRIESILSNKENICVE